MNKNSVIIALVAIVGVAVAVFLVMQSDDDVTDTGSSTQVETTTSDTEPTITDVVEDAAAIVDGTYSASTDYQVPERHTSTIDVEVSVVDGVVEGLDIAHTATSDESEENQDSFDRQIEDLVVGEKLEDIDLSRVGGASLTTDAFMSVLVSIISDARN